MSSAPADYAIPDEDDHAGPLVTVAGRGSVNYLLRNAQQQLVAFSGQADFKASILITACSVVLTIGAGQARDTDLIWGFGVLAAFLLVSMVGAVLCVLPSFTSVGRRAAVPEHQRNPLFFGHFVGWDEDDFVDRLGTILRSDSDVYEAQLRDLHQQGTFLVTHKYRFLRLGYGAFLSGFAVASVVTAASLWAG